MYSKNILEKSLESKYTTCDNCRQDILSEKMFLHEGFCHRNNIFCEHCDKVFLKTDYDEHLKDLRNSINNSAKSTDIGENDYIPVIQEIKQTITTVVNPNTYYEFIEMPLTEEITVNQPIIISEHGNLLSPQNNNEFLLPYLGINTENNECKTIDYQTVSNSISYFNVYDNQDIYRNGINYQMNIINNNNNYYLNNYKINVNTLDNIEKVPFDKQYQLNINSKKEEKQTTNQYNSESNIKIPRDRTRENLTLNINHVRIKNIKTIRNPRRDAKTKNIKEMLELQEH